LQIVTYIKDIIYLSSEALWLPITPERFGWESALMKAALFPVEGRNLTV
jgi:hypothetical protein